MTVLLLLLLTISICFGWMVYAFYKSPTGYEDENGFHRTPSKSTNM